MTAVWLLQNFNPVLFGNVAGSGSFEAGQTFIAPMGGNITGLRWYRVDATTTVPDLLRVWDITTSQLVATAPSIPNSAGAGWKEISLTAPVALVPGRAYVATFGNFAAQSAGRYTIGTAPTLPYPLSFGNTIRRFVAPGTGFPTTGDNVFMHSVDVQVDPSTVITNPPSTAGDVTNSLAAWLLNTNDNTHKTDGLPWETNERSKTIANVLGSTTGQLDATKAVGDAVHSLLTATNKNLGTLWDLAGHLADIEIAAWQSFFHSGEGRLTGTDSGGGSAFYTADGQLVSQLIAEIWQRTLALRGTTPFGGGGWSMSAEESFTDSIAFAEPADAYVLNITSYEPTQPATATAAGLWLYRLGWWCVLTGSLASERSYVEFDQQLLSDQGRRMPGCAIQLKPGTMATVQAWLLA